MYEESGWLAKYLKNRGAYTSETFINIEDSDNNNDFDEFLFYEIIQPTGLIYGYPLKLPKIESEKLNKLSNDEIIKLSLAETLILCSQMFDKKLNKTEEIVENIVKFYNYLFPELKDNFLASLFSGKQNYTQKAENVINKQLKLSKTLDNFWASFFNNSLLFLDIIYFSIWVKSKNTQSTEYLKKEREEVFMILLQIIAIAIHSDNRLDDNEIHFYNLFLKSSKLSKKNLKIAKNYLNYPPRLSTLNLELISSWLLKKYILEIAIIAVWTDKELDALELRFLRELAQKLKFSQEELDKSMMAVELFVLNNWESVPYLQGKKSYELVSNKFIESFKRSINSNKKKISKEISESKELIALLKISKERELTEEENKQVKNQIFDILKTIPMFVIFLIPGSFITMPILFKIIPKNILFPSSFHENDDEV